MTVDASLPRRYQQLHRELGRVLDGLTQEQLYFCPSAGANHIAFIVWHATRTEDIALHSLVQRRPTVWQEQGLDARWGMSLDRLGTGTGLTTERAQALRAPSATALGEYAEGVWVATDRFLATRMGAELDEVIDVGPSGRAYMGLASDEAPTLGEVAVALLDHGNQHLGELWLLRTLQGLPGSGL